MKTIVIVFIFFIFSSLAVLSQVELVDYKTSKDTIFVTLDVNKPIELSRSNHSYVRIKEAIPPDVPEKKREIQIISSKGAEVDSKLVAVDGRDLVIPVSELKEYFYMIYVVSNKQGVFKKRLVIK